ncbi:hypothetical protein ERO13_D04G076950v2 [Gossypium hirsutum]|nr:hypothetical protein ERO13_D04G076950v2 [Gossypium hirsutum]
MHAYSPYAAGPLLLHRLPSSSISLPLSSDSPTPPCKDTFFIAILADFAFTRLVFQRLLFIDLFPDFPGYRLVFLPK